MLNHFPQCTHQWIITGIPWDKGNLWKYLSPHMSHKSNANNFDRKITWYNDWGSVFISFKLFPKKKLAKIKTCLEFTLKIFVLYKKKHPCILSKGGNIWYWYRIYNLKNISIYNVTDAFSHFFTQNEWLSVDLWFVWANEQFFSPLNVEITLVFLL